MDFKEFLEQAPLYTVKKFEIHKLEYEIWENEIECFCNTCKKIKPFQNIKSKGKVILYKRTGEVMTIRPSSLHHNSGNAPFQASLHFLCVSCKKEAYQYLLDVTINNKYFEIQKYGEFPRQQLKRDPLLQKFFKKDSDEYHKALICVSHGYGVGAFVYMRRIVENNIFSLLDTLKEDIGTYGNNEEVLGALAELKKESPMSQRIQVANKALPEYLKSDGINPLRLIYKTLSEGVHSLSDEKCLDKAVILQDCIKFLVGELSERKKHREKFKKSALRLGQSSSLC